MADPIVALPVSGLVTNILSEDGSLIITNPKGNIANIQAKPIISSAAAPVRAVNTVYHTPTDVPHRYIYAALTLIAGSTTTTATYTTTAGGHLFSNVEFGRVTVSGPSGAVVNQFVTFPVDADSDYSINVVLGVGSSSATIRSWVEADSSAS